LTIPPLATYTKKPLIKLNKKITLADLLPGILKANKT
jgi:hypothetical protein